MSEVEIDVLGTRDRKQPKSGDFFVLGYMGSRYVGRVVMTGVRVIPPHLRDTMDAVEFAPVLLIYVYDSLVSETGVMDQVDSVTPPSLAIPPEFVNRTGWTGGYFKTFHHRALVQSELLGRHVFRTGFGEYVDETGNLVGPPSPNEQVGMYAVGNFRTVVEELRLRSPE